jgi:hypothetical protein
MLKSTNHDTGGNANLSGKRLDRRFIKVRFKDKILKPPGLNQRIRRETIRLFFLPGQFRGNLSIA